MANVEDVDFAALLVDAVSDAVLTTSGAPWALKGSSQRRKELAATHLGGHWRNGRLMSSPAANAAAAGKAITQCTSRARRQDHSVWSWLGGLDAPASSHINEAEVGLGEVVSDAQQGFLR